MRVGKIRTEKREYIPAKLQELVERFGLEKLVGKYLVHRVYPDDVWSPRGAVVFSLEVNGVSYEASYPVRPETLESLGFTCGEDMCDPCYVYVILDEDATVWITREPSPVQGSVYRYGYQYTDAWDLDSPEFD